MMMAISWLVPLSQEVGLIKRNTLSALKLLG
jgi:hypothetical protein